MEILIFWSLQDGTRCSVVPNPKGGWRLVVMRNGAELLSEDFSNGRSLLQRADQLRPVFSRTVA